MAIEFTCPGCQSRHACADHMVGRQFKCGGCGKILEVPAGGAADSAPRRRVSGDAGDDHVEERGGMGTGLQLTLLVGGGIALAVIFLFCLGLAPFLFLVGDRSGPGPGGIPVDEVIEKEVGPERAPAMKEFEMKPAPPK